MPVLTNPPATEEYLLDIGYVAIYPKYLVTMLNEGIVLNDESAYELINLADMHFRGKDFICIAVRENSYAVDPLLYTYLDMITNLKGIATVSRKPIDRHNFTIEKHFYKKPMQFFDELDQAIHWAQNLIPDNMRSA